MTKIFICYADHRYKESQNRLVRQARNVGIFDRIIKYTPKDLPDYVKSSPSFAFSRGGGYMCWKPYIVYHTLENCSEGDIVYYADSGCSLLKDSREWEEFDNYLSEYSSIFFQYRNGFKYNGWERYCLQEDYSPVACKHWSKPTLTNFFLQFIDNGFLDYSELWSGFMIIRKTKTIQIIIEQWFKITLFHPELVADPYGAEIENLPDIYYAHRHDQSILTPLVYHYQKQDNALVLPETSESRIGQPAVLATRWIQGKMSWWKKIKFNVWCMIHGES
jgi:hypothetical protein